MEQKYLKGSSGGNNGENESSGNNGENVIVISNCCSANCPRNSGMLEFNLFQILTFLNRAGPERRNKNAKMIFIQKRQNIIRVPKWQKRKKMTVLALLSAYYSLTVIVLLSA